MNISTEEVSLFFKSLADQSRLNILICLLDGEKCVSEIMDEVQMSQSAVSYQLKNLRQMHIVKSRREGKNIFYACGDSHVHEIIKVAVEHINHLYNELH